MLNPYPDGLYTVRHEQLDGEGWRTLWFTYRTPDDAEHQIQQLQRRRDAAGDVRNIELRVFDLVERTGP